MGPVCPGATDFLPATDYFATGVWGLGMASAGIHTALGAAKRTSLPIALVLLCATDVMAREPAPAFVPDSWAGPYIGAYYAVAAGGRSSELADEARITTSERP